MTSKNKNIWDWILKALTPTMIFGAIVTVTLYYGELKETTFDSSEEKHKTKEYVNADVNEVKLFRQSDTLSKRSDTLIQQQKAVKQLYVYQNKILDSIKIDNRKRNIKDSINEIKKELSRIERTKMMNLVLEEIKELKTEQNENEY